MKPRLALLTLVVSLAAALAWTAPVPASSVSAQSYDTEAVDLVPGCQLKALTAYGVGTPLSAVTDGMSGVGANPRLWFQVPGTADFALYDPRSEERSAKTALEAGDEAAFICVDAAAVWTRPAGQAPPPLAIVLPETGDVRSLMERAVPQVTDLPPSMVVTEDGERFKHQPTSPWGPYYFYGIDYGSTLGPGEITSQDLSFVAFGMLLFENSRDASDDFDEELPSSAAELKKAIEEVTRGQLEVRSLTFEDMDISGVGDEAGWIRVHALVWPVGADIPAIPRTVEYIAIRRDRMVGWIVAFWAAAPPGTPGPERVPRRLAEIMDANMQAVLPQLAATTPVP